MSDPFDYGTAAAAIDSIPTALREHRERLGLSLRAVASVIGVSFNTVSRAERGESLTSHSAAAIMHWLDETPLPPSCDRMPSGWICTRAAGHKGPCRVVKQERP